MTTALMVWLFWTVAEHTVGSVAKDACAALAGNIWREFTTAPERLANDDIARVVRGAQLDALEDVVGSYHEANIARWEREQANAPQAFTDTAIAFCRMQRRTLKADATPVVFAPSETLQAAIEGLLADVPLSSEAGARAAALGSFAENAVLEEFATSLRPVEVPTDFAAHLRAGGGRTSPRFLDLFGNVIAERLKDQEDTRFRDILTSRWLAELKAQGFETGEALARVETQFGGLRSDVAGIRQMLREVVDTLTGQLHLSRAEKTALAADLARIKAELSGTVELGAGFLETMVGRRVPPEQFSATLFRIAGDWRAAGARIDALAVSRNLSPRLVVFKAEAQTAHQAGRLDTAMAALAEISRLESETLDRLFADKQEIAQEERVWRLGIAETRAAQAAIASARLSYREAAGYYSSAAQVVAPVDLTHPLIFLGT